MLAKKTGKGPITLKWIDRNKGDREHPNYRSRIVVREVKKQHGALPGHMLFSSMPPLEAVKILCSELATRKKNKKGKDLRLALYDVLSRAHLYGEARREIYVTLPPGDEQEGYGAILKKTMYGTQDASHMWQEGLFQPSEKETLPPGTAWTSVFRHGELDIKLLVHGGDFLVIVDQEGQEYMQQVLKEKYEYRCDGEIGKGSGKHLTILNRIVSYEQETGRVTYRSRSKTCWDDHKTIESAERKECYHTSGEEEKFWSAGIGWTSAGDGRADHALQEFGNESPIPTSRQSRPEWSCGKSDEKDQSAEWKRHERLEKVGKILGRTTKSSQRVPPTTTYECDQSTRRQRPCRMSTDRAKHNWIHYIRIHWNTLRETRIKLAINHCAKQWREWVLCTYPWCCTRTKSEIADGRLGSEIRPNCAEAIRQPLEVLLQDAV